MLYSHIVSSDIPSPIRIKLSLGKTFSGITMRDNQNKHCYEKDYVAMSPLLLELASLCSSVFNASSLTSNCCRFSAISFCTLISMSRNFSSSLRSCSSFNRMAEDDMSSGCEDASSLTAPSFDSDSVL